MPETFEPPSLDSIEPEQGKFTPPPLSSEEFSPHGEFRAAPTTGEAITRALRKTARETVPQSWSEAGLTPLAVATAPLRLARDVYQGIRYGGAPQPSPDDIRQAEEQAFRESRAMPGAFDKVFPPFTPEDIAAHADGAQVPAAIGAAAWNSARQLPRFFTTLPGVATLAGGGVLAAGPAAMAATGHRVIQGGFAVDLASGLPAQLDQSRATLADPNATVLDAAEAVVNPYMTAALVAATTKGAMTKAKEGVAVEPQEGQRQKAKGKSEEAPFVPPPVESIEPVVAEPPVLPTKTARELDLEQRRIQREAEQEAARIAAEAERARGVVPPPVEEPPLPPAPLLPVVSAPAGPSPEEMIKARVAADLAQHEAHLAEGERLRLLNEAAMKNPIGGEVPPAPTPAPAAPVKLFDPAAAGGALARLRAKAAEAKARAEAPPPAPDRELVVDPAEAAAARAYRERVAAEEAAQRQAEAEQPVAPQRWSPPKGEPVEPVPLQREGVSLNEAVRDEGGLTGPNLDAALADMRKGKPASRVVAEFAQGGGEYDALANVLEGIAEARDSGRMSDYNRLRKAYLKTFGEGPRKADLVLEGLRSQQEQGVGPAGGVPEDIGGLIEAAWREATGTGRDIDHDATAMAQAGADYEAFLGSLNLRGNTIHSGEQPLAEVRVGKNGRKLLIPTAEGEALDAEYQNAVMRAAGMEVEHGMTGAGAGELPFTNAARQQQFDPTILRDLTAVAGDIIEQGAVRFPDFARAMTQALAGEYQQYYHAAYNQVREFTEAGHIRSKMTSREESERYDTTGQLTQQPGTAGGGPQLHGTMGGAGGGRRPGLRVVDEGDLPTPRSYVRSGEYTGARGGGIDETQRFAVNLALGSFDLGKPAFLLGDGTGVGKTGTELAIAHQQTLRTKLPSLIVTESRAIIENRFKEDATKLGIPVQDIRFATYTDLSRGKLPPGEFGVVIWDEAHNLKNAGSARASLSKKVNARQQVFATATPMDSPTHAAYFLAQLTGKSREQIAKMLGYHFEEREVMGKLREFAVLDKDTDWHTVVDRIRDLRLRAVQGGQFIRREYPFYGRAAMREAPAFSPDQLADQKLIERHWDDQIDHARSPQMRRNLAGQKTHELSRWAEIQKLPFITESLVEDLAMGKRVVVFAEGYKPTYIKGAGKTVPGLLGALAQELDRRGIKYAKVFEDTGKEKAKAAADFQKDNVKVLLATPRSGGAGLDMDDQIGNRPRQFYAASLNFSAAQFDQMLGRGSRRNTASPAEFHVLTNRESFADRRRIQIADKKLRVLRNIQAGRDLDTSEFERTAAEQEHGMFEGEFSFDQPEGVTEQRARLEQDAKARTAQTAREEMTRRAGRRLTGDTGSLGQGDLLERPEDLFAPPTPGATVREHGYGADANPDLRGREQRGDPAGWQLPGEGKQPEQADLYLRHALRNHVSEAATVQLQRASAASARKNQLTQAFPRTAEGGLDFRRAPIPLIDAVFKAEQEHLDALRGYWAEVNKTGVKYPSHASFLTRVAKADFEHARDSIRAALKSTSKHPDDVRLRNQLTDQWLGLDEMNRRATDELFNDAITAAVETEHGFGGSTSLVKAAAEDVARLRNLVAPQTAGGPARFAGNLLRELNAKLSNELARADVALTKFRRDFDRTPVNLNKFKFDPTLPLPRNLAFIDAYESGNVAALSKLDQLAATEFHKLNTADVARVHALGTGALQTFYANYFPHIWEDPKAAAAVFGKLLGHSPLEGPKSFLKQRTYQLFKDGLAAGLKPVHDNPVDLWLLKKREIERFILAHNFTKEMKDAGLMKFKYAFAKAPDGWRTVDDSAFSVYGPPTVTVKEAFDAGMRQATMDVLSNLGVPHERVTRLGKEWGKEIETPGVPGSERIKSKFAGPDFVIWHELGHVLHNRYADLEPILTATDVMKVEIEALARARTTGTDPASFKRYVQTTPEKMAVVLQAYLHAPDEMQRLAPTVKTAFDSFLNSHPELAQIRDIRPSLRLGVGEAELTHGGLLKLGDYVMPEAAANVVNNFLSPGLNPHLWYRTIRQTSNLLNGVQLGLSAFHLGFTSLDAATSRLAVAMEDAARGKFGQALTTAATVPVSPLTNIRTGAKLRAEVLQPGTHPEMAALAKALEQAGGRVGQDAFWQTEFTRRMKRAWHEGGLQWGTLPLRVPLALWEQTMRPILEYVVPRQKLGVFADMASREMEKLGPTADAATTREALRKAWDSVDNRMGQVVYDNLFYNRSVKDVALIAFRAYGWQLGKYREGLGALADVGEGAARLSRGERPEFSHRMAYAMALPLMVGTIGGVMHYLMTGQQPQDSQDYFQPQTGERDKNGNPVRLNLPSYVKDALAYAKHPLTSFGHSLNPLLSSMFDLLQNKDFYNVEIRHTGDPLTWQGGAVAEFAAKQFIPFSVSGTLKLREDAAPIQKQILPFFGVTPVPQRMTMTPAQELSTEITGNRMPSGPRTREQADASKLVKELVAQIRAGAAPDERWATLTPGQFKTMVGHVGYSPFQFQVHMMPAADAMRVWRVANPAERQTILPIMAAKLGSAATSKNLTAEKAQQLRKWVGEISAPR